MNKKDSLSSLQDTFDHIYQEIDHLSDEDWTELLLQNYSQFELLDQDSNWNFEALNLHQDFLIPPNAKQAIHLLIENIQLGLIENDYFLELLKLIDWNKKEDYSPLTSLDGDHNKPQDYLKYLISFGFCLEQLNLILRDNPSHLDSFIKLYWKIRKKKNFYRWTNILGIIKLHSIEFPLILFLKAWKKKSVRKSFGKFILSFNIFEATLVDYFIGWKSNAKASVPLILFPPNFKNKLFFWKNLKKGKASKFTSDGKALEMFSPKQKEWADLYQVWNMAFVSQFPQAPYLLMKLIIPSVSRYSDRPGEYMHTRITALHLAMNYLDLAVHFPKLKIDLTKLGPANKKLTELWGQVNYSCSRQYGKSVVEKEELQ